MPSPPPVREMPVSRIEPPRQPVQEFRAPAPSRALSHPARPCRNSARHRPLRRPYLNSGSNHPAIRRRKVVGNRNNAVAMMTTAAGGNSYSQGV